MTIARRALLGFSAAAVALLAACSTPPHVGASHPPIVFVHGNGDTAALWQTTIWRFESNGWPRERLHAIDLPYPLARDDDSKPQPGRTSTAEHMAHLASEVDKVLARTGARQVVLVGNSRGGNAIRNYIQNGGGAARVSHAVLGGTPNHGVQAIPGLREGNEFSGTGPFLRGLNAAKNTQGDEVTGPVRWATIRSDNNDKFAQPDGYWIGMRGQATNVTVAGPELKGATNIVVPRIDHRETSYSPAAFEATWRFITGSAPRSTAIAAKARVTLNGKITGLGLNPLDASTGNYVNNLPLPGATLEVYEVDANGVRTGAPAHRKTVGTDGQWGPFSPRAGAALEFVISAPGYATTHIYRSAFPRSSDLIHLRAERIAQADRDAKALVSFTRPRGYFDPHRDRMSLDGKADLPGVPRDPGLSAGVASSRLKLADAAARSVVGEFNGERVAGRTWPVADNRVTMLELTY